MKTKIVLDENDIKKLILSNFRGMADPKVSFNVTTQDGYGRSQEYVVSVTVEIVSDQDLQPYF